MALWRRGGPAGTGGGNATRMNTDCHPHMGDATETGSARPHWRPTRFAPKMAPSVVATHLMEPSHVKAPASAPLRPAAGGLLPHPVQRQRGRDQPVPQGASRLRETAGDPRHHVEQDPPGRHGESHRSHPRRSGRAGCRRRSGGGEPSWQPADEDPPLPQCPPGLCGRAGRHLPA
ncbi:hypothetical protein D3C77_497360 [compost metagenome]